jgi:hypothetical protein
MNLGMLSDMNDIRKAMAAFSEAKRLFDALESAHVQCSDGQARKAIDEAKLLIAQAGEHHATIQLALDELTHPATAKSELERLMAQAQDHHTELGKFMDDAKSFVGAEFETVTAAIAAHEAAQLVK